MAGASSCVGHFFYKKKSVADTHLQMNIILAIYYVNVPK